jgi:hypothetical protein
MFPIRNGLKQGDALPPLLFNFALEYSTRRVHIIQDGLKLNGTRQLLVYADYINMLGGSVYAIKKAKGLVAASKGSGLEINADKNKYMVVSRDQNERQSHNINIDNSSFERMAELKYLGITSHIKFYSGRKSEHMEVRESLLSFSAEPYASFLSNNYKVKIYRTIILPVLYGCKTWSLTLKEKRRLRVFENRVLRRIFGSERDELRGE